MVPPILIVPAPANVKLTAALVGCDVVIPPGMFRTEPELTLTVTPLIP